MNVTNEQVLNCPITNNCSGLGDANTIKEFFVKCMMDLWLEAEDFNAKRPCGNSDWEYEIAESLILAGLVDRFDDSYIGLVLKAIRSLA